MVVEILNDIDIEFYFLFVSVGGGGFFLGVGIYLKNVFFDIKVIVVELVGVVFYFELNKVGYVVIFDKIDKFVDGVVVKKIGEEMF